MSQTPPAPPAGPKPRSFKQVSSGKVMTESELSARGITSKDIDAILKDGSVEEVHDQAPAAAAATEAPKPERSFKQVSSGKIMTQSELTANGITDKDLEAILKDGSVTEVTAGDPSKKKEDSGAAVPASGGLSGFITPPKPDTAASLSDGSVTPEASLATPAAAKAPAGPGIDQKIKAFLTPEKGSYFDTFTGWLKNKFTTPEHEASKIPPPPVMTPDMVKARLDKFLTVPLASDATAPALQQLKGQVEGREDERMRLEPILKGVTKTVFNQMTADEKTYFTNKRPVLEEGGHAQDSKYNYVNTDALDSLLKATPGLTSDSREEVRNRIMRGVEQERGSYDIIKAAGKNYNLGDETADTEFNKTAYEKMLAQDQHATDTPNPLKGTLVDQPKVTAKYWDYQKGNIPVANPAAPDQTTHLEGTKGKPFLDAQGHPTDPMTVSSQNLAKAEGELPEQVQQSTKALDDLSLQLQADVDTGKLSVDQANETLSKAHIKMQGTLKDYIKDRVGDLNKQMGIPAVYQAEADHLATSLKTMKPGTVIYDMTQARIDKIKSLQESGEYSSDDDTNWQRALGKGYKDVMISRNEIMKDVFNNMGMAGESMGHRAPFKDIRNTLGKQEQGLLEGVGALEQMTGGILNMYGMYTLGNKVTANGKAFSAANELPMALNAQGEEQVIDDSPSTWIARNVSAQIGLMAGLAAVAQIGGEAVGGSLLEGLGLVSEAHPFLKGAMGGLIEAIPESMMEAGDYYNQAISEGKTVWQARQGSERVLHENLIMTAFTNPLEFGLMKMPLNGTLGGVVHGGIEVSINGTQEIVQNWIQNKQTNPALSLLDYALSPEGQSTFLSGAAVGVMQSTIMGKLQQWQVNRATNAMFNFNSQYGATPPPPAGAAPAAITPPATPAGPAAPGGAAPAANTPPATPPAAPPPSALPNNYTIARTIRAAYDMHEIPTDKRTTQLKKTIDRLEASGAYTEEDAIRVKALIDDVAAVKDQVPDFGTDDQRTSIFNELLQIHTNNKFAKRSGIKEISDLVETNNKVSTDRIKRIMEGTEPLYFVGGNETNKEQLLASVDLIDKAGKLASKDIRINVSNDPATEKIVAERIAAAKKNAKEDKKKPPVTATEAINVIEPVVEPVVEPEKTPAATKPTAPIDATDIEARKKLSGWPASYELAKIAKAAGVDLSAMNREDYAQYAIDNNLAIDDAQLRAAPWQRNHTSVESLLAENKTRRKGITDQADKDFNKFSVDMQNLAAKPLAERYIAPDVRILSGTKDSNSWLHFGINEGTNDDPNADTHKAYFSFKDLNSFSVSEFKEFLTKLQARGFNGNVKTFQDMSNMGVVLNDQVVMHGKTEADAKLANDVANEFYGEQLAHQSMGKDIPGKSYSQVLAERIKNEINNPTAKKQTKTEPAKETETKPAGAPVVDEKKAEAHEVVPPATETPVSSEPVVDEKNGPPNFEPEEYSTPDDEVTSFGKPEKLLTSNVGKVNADFEEKMERASGPEEFDKFTEQMGGLLKSEFNKAGLSEDLVTEKVTEHFIAEVYSQSGVEANEDKTVGEVMTGFVKGYKGKEVKKPKTEPAATAKTETKTEPAKKPASKPADQTLEAELDSALDELADAQKKSRTEKKTEAEPEVKEPPATVAYPLLSGVNESTPPVEKRAHELLDAINEGKKGKERHMLISIIKQGPYYVLAAGNGKDFTQVFNVLDEKGETPAGMSANWRHFAHIKEELKEYPRPLPFTYAEAPRQALLKLAGDVEAKLAGDKQGAALAADIRAAANERHDTTKRTKLNQPSYSEFNKRYQDLLANQPEKETQTEQPIPPLKEVKGATNKAQVTAFLERLNTAPRDFAGSEEKSAAKGRKKGASFEFIDEDGRSTTMFVEGDYDTMDDFVEEYMQSIEDRLPKRELPGEDGPEDDFDYGTIRNNKAYDRDAMWKNDTRITAEQIGRTAPVVSMEEAKKIVDGWEDTAIEMGKTQDNSKKVIISLFDRTGAWTEGYHDAGYITIHIDVQHDSGPIDYDNIMQALRTGDRRFKIGGDIMEGFPNNILELKRAMIDNGYEVVGLLSATPCTTFAASGAQHWKTLHDAPDFDEVDKRYGRWAAKHFDSPSQYNQGLVDLTQEWIRQLAPTSFHVMENPVGRLQEVTGLPDEAMGFHPNLYGDPYTKKTLLWGKFNTNLPTAHVEATQGSKMQQKYGSGAKNERSETPHGFAYAFFMANSGPAEITKRETAAARAKTLKPGDQVTFKSAGNTLTGNYVTIPGYEDMDFVAVSKGVTRIHELSTGAEIRDSDGGTEAKAIENARQQLLKTKISAQSLYSKVYDHETGIGTTGTDGKNREKSPAYQKYKAARIAAFEALPDTYSPAEKAELEKAVQEARDQLGPEDEVTRRFEDLVKRAVESKVDPDAKYKSSLRLLPENLRAHIAPRLIERENKEKIAAGQPLPEGQKRVFGGDYASFFDFLNQGREIKNILRNIPDTLIDSWYESYVKMRAMDNKYGYHRYPDFGDMLFKIHHYKIGLTKDDSKRKAENLREVAIIQEAIDATYKKEFGTDNVDVPDRSTFVEPKPAPKPKKEPVVKPVKDSSGISNVVRQVSTSGSNKGQLDGHIEFDYRGTRYSALPNNPSYLSYVNPKDGARYMGARPSHDQEAVMELANAWDRDNPVKAPAAENKLINGKDIDGDIRVTYDEKPFDVNNAPYSTVAGVTEYGTAKSMPRVEKIQWALQQRANVERNLKQERAVDTEKGVKFATKAFQAQKSARIKDFLAERNHLDKYIQKQLPQFENTGSRAAIKYGDVEIRNLINKGQLPPTRPRVIQELQDEYNAKYPTGTSLAEVVAASPNIIQATVPKYDFTDPSKKSDPKMDALNAELDSALDELSEASRKSRGKLSMNGIIDPEMLAKGIKVMGILTKMGIHKFSEVVRVLIKKFGKAYFDILTPEGRENRDSIGGIYAYHRRNTPREERGKYDSDDTIDDFMEKELPGLLAEDAPETTPVKDTEQQIGPVQVGDDIKAMGQGTFLATNVETVEGVEFALFSGPEGKGLIRVFDIDSNHVVGITSYPTLDKATKKYNEYLAIAKMGEAPRKPETEPVSKPEIGAAPGVSNTGKDALSLKGKYDTKDSTKADDHETGNRAPERKFKHDITVFARALAEKTGWEFRTEDKGKNKGRKVYPQTNIAPAGGNGTIELFKPGADQGVYISIPADREGEDLVVRGTQDLGIMYRTIDRKGKSGANQWIAVKDFTVAEMAKRIEAMGATIKQTDDGKQQPGDTAAGQQTDTGAGQGAGTGGVGTGTGQISENLPPGLSPADGEIGGTGQVPGPEGVGSDGSGNGPDQGGDEQTGSQGDSMGAPHDVSGGPGKNVDVNESLGGTSKDLPAKRPGQGVLQPARNGNNFVIPENFQHTDTFNVSQKYDDNIAALETLISLLKAGTTHPTVTEQASLFKYVGFGGLKDVLLDHEDDYYWTKSNARFRPKVVRIHELAEQLEELGIRRVIDGIEASVLNAHFTAIPVIRAIYAGLGVLGYEGGNTMEPSVGIGHFYGAMPLKMLQNSILSAVEKEPLTAHIFKLLYPDVATFIGGLEESDTPHNKFDLNITNAPFGNNIGVHDSAFNKSKVSAIIRSQKKIHNYFMAKAIEMARPGGLVVMVTSSGIMDAADNDFLRKHMANTTEFLGAIRLPNNAFKANANTEVVTDIIFLRKFNNGEKIKQDHDFLGSKIVKLEHHEKNRSAQDIDYNQWYHDHPEYMLGTPMAGGMYSGSPDLTVIAHPGVDLEKAIGDAATKMLQGKQYTRDVNFATSMEAQKQYFVDAAKNAKPGNLAIGKDGKVGTLSSEQPAGDTPSGQVGTKSFAFNELQAKTGLPVKEVQAFIKVRDALNDLFASEISGAGDIEVGLKRDALNKVYNAFTRAHGNLSTKVNKKIISHDIDSYNVLALEKIDKETGAITKSDIFTKRTLRPYYRQDRADNVPDALLISLNETGNISPDRISELMNRPFEEIAAENKDLVYELPEGGWASSTVYLSGNVREKLAMAKAAALLEPRFAHNVTELEKVVPTDLRPVDIEAPIGSRWIDVSYYDQFAKELFNTRNVRVGFLPASDTYKVNLTGNSAEARITYGTVRMGGTELMVEALHNRSPLVFDTTPEPENKRILNVDATAKAVAKFRLIQEKFNDWVWKDPARREALSRTYNDMFNTTIARSNDGSFLKFPGLNAGLVLDSHQKDAVWMLLQNQGGIIDHIVGAGKTFIMVVTAMEMKRMGISAKTAMVVLKSTLPQVREAFKYAYPLANVLIIEDGDFTAKSRKSFLAQIGTNNYDAVVMTHENFKAIPQDNDFQREIIQEEVDMLDIDIEALARETGPMSKQQLKGLQSRRLKLLAKMRKLADMERDFELRNFQDLGFEHLMVDESQEFKNLAYTTKSRGVAGLGKADGAQKTFNMLLGVRWMQKIHRADKGVTFLSGTPISNSIVEMDLLLKYLRPSKLAALRMPTFDSWAATFAQHTEDAEFSVVGAMKMKDRFRRFVNLPELSMLYKEIADVRDDSNLKQDKPRMKGGGMIQVPVKPSAQQQAFSLLLMEFARTKNPEPLGLGVHYTEEQLTAHMLLATNMASKAAIDMRLLFPNAGDPPGGKLWMAADKVAAMYRESNDVKGTQLVFSDLGTPKSGNVVEDLHDLLQDEYLFTDEDMRLVFGEGEGLPKIAEIKKRLREVMEYTDKEIEAFVAESKTHSKFNIYDEFKKKLIERGIPAKEIVFIHSYKTGKQKLALFDAVNAGEIRVVLGSTRKLGTGVNVQERIVSIHHLDVPWRPSDMDQRNGRGIRRGNIIARDYFDNEVGVYNYATEMSLDAMKYQVLANKDHAIKSVKANTTGLRTYTEDEANEESGFSYAAFTALLTGNTDIIDKARVDKEVMTLAQSKKNFDQDKYDAENSIDRNNATIRRRKDEVKDLNKDLATIAANSTKDDEGRIVFKVEVFGQTFDKASEAGAYYRLKLPETKSTLKNHEKRIVGKVYGFDVVVEGISDTYRNAEKETVSYIRTEEYLASPVTANTYEIRHSEDEAWQGRYLTAMLDAREMRDNQLGYIKKAEDEIVKYQEVKDAVWGKEDKLIDARARQKVLQERIEAEARGSLNPSTEKARNISDDAAFLVAPDKTGRKVKQPLFNAEKISFPGTDMKFWIGQFKDGWRVVETTSGSTVRTAATKEQALNEAKAIVAANLGNMEKLITEAREENLRRDPNIYDDNAENFDGYDDSWEADDIDEAIRKARKDLGDDLRGNLSFGPGAAIMALPKLAKLAYLYMRKGLKTVGQFAKALGERMSKLIVKGWNIAASIFKKKTSTPGGPPPKSKGTGTGSTGTGTGSAGAAPGAAPSGRPTGTSVAAKLAQYRWDVGEEAKVMQRQYQINFFGSPDINDKDPYVRKFDAARVLNYLSNLPNLLQDKTTKKLGELGSKGFQILAEKAMDNQNQRWGKLARAVGKSTNSVFSGLGKNVEDMLASEKFVGEGRVRNIADTAHIQELLHEMVEDPLKLARINQVVDPEFYTERDYDEWQQMKLDELNGDMVKFAAIDPKDMADSYAEYRKRFGFDEPGYKLTTQADLDPDELQVYNHIRFMYDMMHKINFAMGKLTPETYEKNIGNYSARLYDFYEVPKEVEEMLKGVAAPLKLEESLYMKKGELTQWKLMNGISDPIYSVTKRLAQTMSNKAVIDYANYLIDHKPGAVSPTERAGYRKLGNGYGPLRGKWVRDDIAEDFVGHFFSMALMDKFYKWTKEYAQGDSYVSRYRRFMKKSYTVGAPATHVGNILGNGVFAWLSGINGARMLYNTPWALKQKDEYSAVYRYLLSMGVLGTDITKQDLRPPKPPDPSAPPSASGTPPTTMGITGSDLKKGFDWLAEKAQSFYSGTDDVAKIAAYKSLIDLGYSPRDAVNRVKTGFQNYNRVGKLYKFFSGIPVIGQPFGAFAGDLARIVRTGMIERPLNTLAMMAVLKGASLVFSHLSGESDRDRRIREARAGAVFIPWFKALGGNIPLEWRIGGNTWNMARILSPVFLYGGASGEDDWNFLQKFSPMPIETVDWTKNPNGRIAGLVAKNTNDPAFGPLVQVLVDSDFRTVPILDPGVTKYQPKPTLTPFEQGVNASRYLLRGYLPYGGSIDDGIRAIFGQKDYYNRDKSVGQNFASFWLGVKVARFSDTRYGDIMEQKMNSFGFQFQEEDATLKVIAKQFRNNEISREKFYERIAPHLVKKSEIVEKAKAVYLDLTGKSGGFDLTKDDVIHGVNKRTTQPRRAGALPALPKMNKLPTLPKVR